ncbi:MAG: LytTR family transcriptional regulator [Alteromonadaceae bacterium]|nr:LytTR family transcriptional regulator [Alteromonadaceae bacterium]
MAEAYGNYVKLWRGDDITLVSSSLKLVIEQLPNKQFTQVHKSFVVNNSKVAAVETEFLTLECGRIIKVGKSFKKMVQQLL